jgi:hypothetical protein
MDMPVEDSLTLYKPNGDEVKKGWEEDEDKAGEWTWTDVKNFAEGNLNTRDFGAGNWMWKAQKAFEAGDGETLGNMVYEIMCRYSKKLRAQAETGTFTFTVSPSNDPGAVGGSDMVTVIVDSGNPGGDPGEFEEYMKKVLSDWFDTEVN